MADIESVLRETRVFEPSPEFVAQANVARADYEELVADAEKDYAGYWAKLARDHLAWHKPFTKSLDESKAPFYKWFADGSLNASYNCLDRHLKTNPNKYRDHLRGGRRQGDEASPTSSSITGSASSPTGSRRSASRKASA